MEYLPGGRGCWWSARSRSPRSRMARHNRKCPKTTKASLAERRSLGSSSRFGSHEGYPEHTRLSSGCPVPLFSIDPIVAWFCSPGREDACVLHGPPGQDYLCSEEERYDLACPFIQNPLADPISLFCTQESLCY